MRYEVVSGKLEGFKAKIEKLNRRAEKLGLPKIELIFEEKALKHWIASPASC